MRRWSKSCTSEARFAEVHLLQKHPFCCCIIVFHWASRVEVVENFHCEHDGTMVKIIPMASNQCVIAMAVGVMLAAVVWMFMTNEQREGLLDYGRSCMPTATRERRISSSKTPPRSVSPDKKVPNNAPSPVDYKDIFPPSRREQLAHVSDRIPPAQRECLQAGQVDPAAFRKGLIPFDADYRKCGPSTYTPTEFSVEEIKALGDFPDYAELSGVPLPVAYQQFQIESARARPYRPFRWAYHQTMCRSFHPGVSCRRD